MTSRLVDPKFVDLMSLLSDEVQAVETHLTRLLGSRVQLVEQIGLHTLAAGGKRLRPALAILTARAVGNPFHADRVRELAAALEMVHMATLLHDDVIDHAETRRGKPTASSVFGKTAGILTGDVLLAKAMSVLAKDGDLNVIRAVSQAVVDLSEGEVREVETRAMLGLSVEAHLDILFRKTASFLKCCCEVGVFVSQGSDKQLDALGSYGLNLGMAFQIADDLLDYRGTRSKTGKPRATDFREGCPTLPLLLSISKMPAEMRDEVCSQFGGDPSDEQVDRVCDILEQSGGFAEATRYADDYAERAIRCLDELPLCRERELLESVVHFSIQRES